MEQTFTEPSEEEYTQLAKMWMAAESLIKEEYSYSLGQTPEDLIYLQKVIDDDLLGNDNEYGFYCLGTALGRLLANSVEGLDWWSVEDEYGKDTIIRYLDTSFSVNVIPLIWRRVIEEPVTDINSLYTWILDQKDEYINETR
ncbi:MAG: DUF3806 domain-containing protein [Verrucomicrobiota bacterium]